MALTKHETKAVAGSVVTPATTEDLLNAYGCEFVMMSTTAAIRFTVDGSTDPVITGGSEVGQLLSTTNEGGLTHWILTKKEFLNLRMLDVSADARVQFDFLEGGRARMG